MTAHLAYTWLEAKRQWRDREVLIFRLGLPLAIYLILQAAGSSDNITAHESGLSEVTSGTARMLALAALAAVISGLAAGPALGEERANGWLHQLRVTPLRPGAAVIGKIAVAMNFALPAVALVIGAAGVVEAVSLGWGELIELTLVMWVATAPITALGTLIGLTFAAEAAQAATTLTFIVLWLLGGLMTPLSNMPNALATVGRALPSNGVIDVGWASASGDTIPVSAAIVLLAWTVGAGAAAALAWRRVISR